jgi:hypothetical protein
MNAADNAQDHARLLPVGHPVDPGRRDRLRAPPHDGVDTHGTTPRSPSFGPHTLIER